MARNILNSVLSFLSTAVFFAVFILLGDVLVAATAAVATALVQFVVRRLAYHRAGVLMWASLALVLALTGLTLKGDDAIASTLSQAQLSRQAAGQAGDQHQGKCSCRMPAGLTEANLFATPTL